MSSTRCAPHNCCCCSLCFCFVKEEKTPKFSDISYKLVPPLLPGLASDKTFALPQLKANTAALVQGHQVIQEGEYARSRSLDVQSSQEARRVTGAISQQPKRVSMFAGRTEPESSQLVENPTGNVRSAYAKALSREPSPLSSPPSKYTISRAFGCESPLHSAHKMIVRKESFLGEGEERSGLQAAHFARRVPKLYFSLYYDVQRRALTIDLIKAEKLPPKPRGAACNPFVMIYIMPHKHGVRQSEIRQGTLNPVFHQGFEFCNLQLNEVKNQVLVFVINDNEM